MGFFSSKDVPLSTQQARATTDEIVYDENGLPIPELDASIPDIHENNFDNDGFDNLGDDIEEEVGARLAGARPPVAFITDMRPGDGPVSDKPLQYSYRLVVCFGPSSRTSTKYVFFLFLTERLLL